MITNRRNVWVLGRICGLTLGGLLVVAAWSGGCGGGGSGGSGGKGGGTAGSSGGGTAGGSAGATGLAGRGGSGMDVGGTSGLAGVGGGGNAMSVGGTTGGGGTAGAAGSAGAAGAAGSAGSAGSAGAGGGAGAGGRGGSFGGAGAGGRGGSFGGGIDVGGALGSAGNCSGDAIGFNSNVSGKNDPAMASVNIPMNSDLPVGNASRTIEFWASVPSSAWAADANTMFFYGTNNRNNDGFGLDFGTTTSAGIGTIDPFTNNSTTDPMGDNKPSGLMANVLNQWAHFAMTWDGANLHAYVNGVEKVTVAIPNMLHTGATALTIGGYPPNYFNGLIDEFRIWNVAHTATEIQATMNKTLVGNETGLVAYYKFDENSGTTALDSVTTAGHTAHPGTLTANMASNNPARIVPGAPLTCP
jgi:hypothetical protein